MKQEQFLKWWLLVTLITIGCVFGAIYGLPQEIWKKDSSYLSAATFAIFCFYSCACGVNIWLSGACKNPSKDYVNKLRESEETGWFVSEICLNLGMLGTIIGFVLMLGGFEGLSISDQSSIQKLLSELGKSMATALYTTMVGLACGQLLKMQTFLLSMALDSLEKQAEENENNQKL